MNTDTIDYFEDNECPICHGEGFTFNCFDGFCADADWGCDDCTHRCECQRNQGAAKAGEE
jgi:hypothetical protein